MLSYYIKIALRNLIKHRFYSLINIAGLALGLAVFIFNFIFVAYENSYDSMFSLRERIFIISSVVAPTADKPVKELPTIPTAYGPLFDLEIEDAEQVARSTCYTYLLTVENNQFYGGIRFVDGGFTRIFDFKYIYGGPTAIDDPLGLIVTESTARKLFGRTDVMGETVTLDHKHPMRINGVIEDIPKRSHFYPLIPPPPNHFIAIAPYKTLADIHADFDLEGNWKGFGPNCGLTYILLSKKRDQTWLQDQVDAVYDRYTPPFKREFISGLKVRPLAKAHNWLFEIWGLPRVDSVQLLSLLVLIVACINYINLATAQNFGRTREVGLRKTLGAERSHLLVQFLVESLIIAASAMTLAMAAVELLIPPFNTWTDKTLALDYRGTLPWVMLITVTVGLLSGAYPAYLISRFSPIDSLRNTLIKNQKGKTFRGLMIAAQFSISIFILAMVMVVYFQNLKIEELGKAFPKDDIVILYYPNNPEIKKKLKALRHELKTLAHVKAVTFSSSLPFEGAWDLKVTPKQGDENSGFIVDMMSIDFDFMEAYDIELLAGRPFNPNIEHDMRRQNRKQLNVIVNRLAAEMLGFLKGDDKAENALGKSFHRITDKINPQPEKYTIVGVAKNVNFNGFIDKTKPIVFLIEPNFHYLASVRIGEQNHKKTISDIEVAWKRGINNYPLKYFYLDEMFHQRYMILDAVKDVLAIFATVAFSLALTGLFSLAALMAQHRTKEIGIRKVMGGNKNQIVRLLIWQFSLPVIWSLAVAVPLAYISAKLYLDLFAERIDFVLPIILLACVLSILTAWGIVTSHAITAARTKPANSLRYE